MIAGLVDAAAGVLHGAAAAIALALGLSGGGSPSLPALIDAACDRRLVLREGSAVRSTRLDEVSGIVESRRRAGVLWLHNDSGDTARLFAIGLDGRTLGRFTLAGVDARDWEDIAAGPGPVAGRRYLYVGDIGDNARTRASISVLRLREPVVSMDAATPVTRSVTGVDELVLRYPDGPHDAEALLVDPRSGVLLVITKQLHGQAGVFRAPAGLAGGSETVLRRVATLRLGFGVLVTGGDVSRSGSVVALRTYGSVLLYARPAGRPLAAAFRGRRCQGLAPPELQGEAIALRTDGRSYVTLGEGDHLPLYHVRIRVP